METEQPWYLQERYQSDNQVELFRTNYRFLLNHIYTEHGTLVLPDGQTLTTHLLPK